MNVETRHGTEEIKGHRHNQQSFKGLQQRPNKLDHQRNSPLPPIPTCPSLTSPPLSPFTSHFPPIKAPATHLCLIGPLT
ncbi:hypothetical protein E2C01_067568 [Portunus trituberculatus]|uniref:Uncharacterized protein n=1 Tax=Portunus trituberculatus TaxID=210409 RepID=A0A5B7HU40_PORTR|nr:hypothetical protein [Portunus trituberculatus]